MMDFYDKNDEGVKQRFLDNLKGKKSSKKLYEYILKDASLTEEIYGKDLFNFSLSEIADVIQSKQNRSESHTKWKGYIIKKYIDWAIDNEYRENRINPLSGVDGEWYHKLVSWNVRELYSKEEIDDVIENTHNDQDKALIMMIFEGAQGTLSSELTNLNVNDINWNTGEVILREDEHTKRTITVLPETLNYLRKAHEQYMYVFNNGTKKPKSRRYEAELKSSDYIFKTAMINKRNEQKIKVSPYTLTQRLRSIQEDLFLETLTLTAIRKSGILYYAHNKIVENGGKFNQEVVDYIGERFGYKKIKVPATNNKDEVYEYHSKTKLRNVVNEDNLRTYYSLDI